MKKCLGLCVFVFLFAAAAAQAGTCSDCVYCEVGANCGYGCNSSNGSYANCARYVCYINADSCPFDDSTGDCVWSGNCGCWFFMLMYWTNRQPVQHYDAHQWRLVR